MNVDICVDCICDIQSGCGHLVRAAALKQALVAFFKEWLII